MNKTHVLLALAGGAILGYGLVEYTYPNRVPNPNVNPTVLKTVTAIFKIPYWLGYCAKNPIPFPESL
jgi:hypothetical protein